MSTSQPLHIFKPGRQTAMSGAVLDFSAADLAACARAYDPALHEAPIVIGHPRHDAPAYGWVKSLAAGGDGLEATPQQVDAAFAELVASGRYKKISASFYLPDAPNNPVPGVYYLRHVGFLGAQPPAVKGLKQAAFADAEAGVVEFAATGLHDTASLWRRLREWLLTKFDKETADQVVPDWQIESIAEQGRALHADREAARQDDTPRAAFADPADTTVSPTQTTEEERHVSPEEKAALEAENAQLKQRLAAAEAATTSAAAARRHGEHAAFAEQMIGEGKLAPKHKDAVVAFLDFADGESAVEFGEGAARQPLAAAFKAFLGDMPKVVEFGETATKDKSGKGGDTHAAEFAEKPTDPDRLSLHVRATELAAEKGIPYEQAVRQLL